MIDLSSQITLENWKFYILLEEHAPRQDFNQLFPQTQNLSLNPDSMWKFKTAPLHIHTTFIDHTGEILTGNGTSLTINSAISAIHTLVPLPSPPIPVRRLNRHIHGSWEKGNLTTNSWRANVKWGVQGSCTSRQHPVWHILSFKKCIVQLNVCRQMLSTVEDRLLTACFSYMKHNSTIIVWEGVFHDQRLSVLILAREEQSSCLFSNVAGHGNLGSESIVWCCLYLGRNTQ